MRSLRVVPPGELPAAEGESGVGVDPADSAGATSAPGTGDAIVVEAEDGERFQLTLDEALRDAVGPSEPAAPSPEHPRGGAGRGPSGTGTPLTPREIQTRVRAGESAQDLADDSGTSIDKIMRFAYAVLEERSRVADEARRARARRDGDGNLVPFGETVDSRFAAASIVPQSVEWDSFRRPDGSWVVSAAWSTDGTERHAHWAFSLTTRTVLPLDQVSSDLLSDRPLRPVVRAVPDAADAAASAAELYDQEAPQASNYPAPPSIGRPRGTTSTAASANGAPGKSAPGKPAPGKPAPGKSAPGKSAPGNAASANAQPGNTAPASGTPGNAASANAAPGNAASANAAPGNAASANAAPGNAASANGAPANSSSAAAVPPPAAVHNPPLPLRLADPWDGGGGRGDSDTAASPAIEDTATTGDDMDGEGVDGIDVGDDTSLDELFDDDFIDDQPGQPAAAPPAPPVSSGRSRSSRSQSKVPRWDDILLSTRRKND